MGCNLFEPLDCVSTTSITDLKDLSSEFMTTHACCEEGQCCDQS